MNIGQQIHSIIDDRDMTQKTLSELLDIPLSTLNGYMTGRHQFPPEVIQKIACVLDVTSDYLLELSKNPNQPIALTKTEQSLIEEFRTLSPDQKNLLCQIAHLMWKQNQR